MPVVTLTTDFGLEDTYVGIMKGVILSIAPRATLVDLCHQIPSQDILTAAFMLYQAVPFFPPDTVHLAVVDPGVGGARRALAVRTDQGVFVAPDNGLLTFVIDSVPVREAVYLTVSNYHLPQVSATFHGRDIFAPVAAHLVTGVPLASLGPPASDLTRLPAPRPRLLPDGSMIGHVIHVDHFGNLILDVTGKQVRNARILQMEGFPDVPLEDTYSDVEIGELVAYVGSTAHTHLEIAVRNGNAAQSLNLQAGDPIQIRMKGK